MARHAVLPSHAKLSPLFCFYSLRTIAFVLVAAGPLFASSLLNRLHIMMTTMLILTIFSLLAIFVVIKRLLPSTKKSSSNEIRDTHNNHSSSLEDDSDESASALALASSSKNCYVTLVQHDDEQHTFLDKQTSLIKRSSNNITNGEPTNASLRYDTSSTNVICESDEQHRTI